MHHVFAVLTADPWEWSSDAYVLPCYVLGTKARSSEDYPVRSAKKPSNLRSKCLHDSKSILLFAEITDLERFIYFKRSHERVFRITLSRFIDDFDL